MGSRVRIDALLTERGLFETRSRAATAVRAGEVRVGRGGRRALKPGELVTGDIELAVDDAPRYVSRGGRKLANALDVLGLDPAGRDCLDLGASTGGFTDCLLQRGARRVVCVDVAGGELDWSLRGNERVTLIERTNARFLEPSMLPLVPQLCVADLSFISLRAVLPAIAACMPPRADVLAMVKPQFEAGREHVGKQGVVRDPAVRREALIAVADAAGALGLGLRGFASSGLPGPKGNRETFAWLRAAAAPTVDAASAAREVEP